MDAYGVLLADDEPEILSMLAHLLQSAGHKVVGQAKGIMMKKHGLREDEARGFLQQESQRQSKPLPELAKAIVLAGNAFSHSVQSDGAAVDAAT